jgi:hypothetical protein
MSLLYNVSAIIVLDSDGQRLLAKYYDSKLEDVRTQRNFERVLFKKTQPMAQVMALESYVVVYKNVGDVCFYVLGDMNENELLLDSVLSAFYEAVAVLLRNQIDRRTMLENIDYMYLALDELVDKGIILESDAHLISERVVMKEGGENPEASPISEQTLVKALGIAKDIFMG